VGIRTCPIYNYVLLAWPFSPPEDPSWDIAPTSFRICMGYRGVQVMASQSQDIAELWLLNAS
jgi:hypothetical protein